MKAFLMAAGVGTRLRPITETTPKCLVPIRGVPLLDIWLDALAAAGVDEVLVNVHHLPGEVGRHVERRTAGPRVTAVHEPQLLGSAGTLRANRGWVAGEDRFLVCYADNLTDFDPADLVSFHDRTGGDASLALFRTDRPSACGIVEIDSRGRVTGFEEKPPRPRSDLANAGIYVFTPAVLDDIPDRSPADIGYDLLPRLVGRAWGMPVQGYFRDIGTVGSYERAQVEWKERTLR